MPPLHLIVSALVLFGSATPQPLPTPDMTPPIAVEGCASGFQSDTNPNLKVGISFRNNSTVDAVEIKFAVELVNGSGKVLDTQVESISGKFSPNVFIEPRRGAINNSLLTQPEYPNSPAWNVANHYGSDVAQVRCVFDSARFSDGSVWPRSP